MSEKLKFSIGVDLSELEKGLDKASASIKSFADRNKEKFEQVGKSMVDVGAKMSILSGAVIAGIGAMGLLAKNVGNVADRLFDLRDITGASTDAIQEWQYIAKIAGVNTETFTNATEGLVRRLKDVGEEGSPAVKILRDLGIQTNDASGAIRNSGVIVDETIRKLATLENVTERNALGSQLFGGAWKDVAPILSLGADGIEQLKNEAHDLGLVMSETALTDANNFRIATEKVTARIEALKNSIGAKLAPVMERTLIPLINNYVIPAFEKIANMIVAVINWFNDLNPTVKTIIGVIAGLVVAIGPLLVIIGTIIQFLPVLIAGFAALTGPIGLIVLGVVALTAAIVANWNTIKQWAQDSVNYFIRLYNKSMLFRAGIEYVIFAFKGMWEVVKFVAFSIYNVITTVFKNIWETIKGVADLIVSVLTFDLAGIKASLSKTFNAVTGNVSKLFNDISNDAKDLFNNISKNASEAVKNTLTGELKEVDFTTSEESTKKLQEAVTGAVSAGVANGLGGRAQLQAVNAGMTPTGIAEQPTAAITTDLSQLSVPMATALTEIEMMLFDFNERAGDIINNRIADTFAGIGMVIGDALTGGGNAIEKAGSLLLGSLGGLLVDLGKMAIQTGVGLLGIKTALKSLNPAVAIAAGVALVALGSAFSKGASGISNSIGGGGSIGNARGSSSSGSPSSSFSSFSAQSGNEVVFRIAGSDLLGVLRRAEGNEQRLG